MRAAIGVDPVDRQARAAGEDFQLRITHWRSPSGGSKGAAAVRLTSAQYGARCLGPGARPMWRVFEQQRAAAGGGVEHRRGAEVQVNAQQAAIAQAPARAHRAVGQHLGAQCLGAGQVRDDLPMADLQQLAIQLCVAMVRWLSAQGADASKVCGALGSGIRSRLCGSVNAAKAANSLRRPSRTASASSPWWLVKNRKGCSAANFIAHEHQRNHRRQQQQHGGGLQRLGRASWCRRSPKARLPIWSWFCKNSTNALGGRCPLGSPRGWPWRVVWPW